VQGALPKFRNSGQTCGMYESIPVQPPCMRKCSSAIAAAVSLKVGNGMQGDTTQAPLDCTAAVAKVKQHIADR